MRLALTTTRCTAFLLAPSTIRTKIGWAFRNALPSPDITYPDWTMKETAIAITYLIYVILWDGMIFAGCGYAVFWLHESGWWFLAACFVGGCAYQPDKWADLWRPTRRAEKKQTT
jgi:hypothetical protein